MAKKLTIGRVRVRTEELGAAAVAIALVTAAAALWAPLGLGLGAGLVVLALLLGLRARRERTERAVEQLEALTSLVAGLGVRAPLPPMRGFAASPDFVRVAVERVLSARPARVLELGSGVSTILLAYALERVGHGRLVALEHDAGYAARTREWLAIHGLTGVAEVRHAPLATVAVGGETHTWYDAGDALDGGPFGLVVVDGPPAPPASRWPVVPLLAGRLDAGAALVLDDAARGEARANLARWAAADPALAVRRVDTEKGTAVLTWARGPGEGP